MSKNKSKILAIDPGTREMGIAFFDKGKIIYYGVKTIKKGKSPSETLKEGRKIILRLIKDFKPDNLIAEKAFFANNRRASLLNVFVDKIKSIARRKKLKLLNYAPSTVKKAICGNGRASKKDVARVIISKYPELKVYLTQDRAWKELYHQNMFDAVALGMMIK
ncbi:MAG TPA: crossover junction endodeoxyribonuclease RuvC [Nitrospinota bacterium]|nr:crossover junction endodeoxyribonuclease RuvC [Nitrospinota bacterium]